MITRSQSLCRPRTTRGWSMTSDVPKSALETMIRRAFFPRAAEYLNFPVSRRPVSCHRRRPWRESSRRGAAAVKSRGPRNAPASQQTPSACVDVRPSIVLESLRRNDLWRSCLPAFQRSCSAPVTSAAAWPRAAARCPRSSCSPREWAWLWPSQPPPSWGWSSSRRRTFCGASSPGCAEPRASPPSTRRWPRRSSPLRPLLPR